MILRFANNLFPIATKSMVSNLVVVLAMVLLAGSVSGQGWELSFGGSKEDQGKAIVQTLDGGFVIAGTSESFGEDNDLDILLVRTDENGEILWTKVIDEGNREIAFDLLQTADGGFLVAGSITLDFSTQADAYLLKVNADGDFVWSKTYGTESFEQATAIAKAPDGGYILVGKEIAPATAEEDMLAIKVTEEGEQVWLKTFGTAKDDDARGVIGFTEFSGGYMVVGVTDNATPNSFDNDIFIWRLDLSGERVWNWRPKVSEEREEANKVIRTKDGNFILVGLKGDNSDAYIAKFDFSRNLLWDKSIGGNLGDEGTGIAELSDGNFIITGYTEVEAANTDVLVAKTDVNGNQLWLKNLGSRSNTETGEDIIATMDGGYAIAGNTSLLLGFVDDLLVLKTDGKGNTKANYITGVIAYDADGQCDTDPAEKGMKGWLVRAHNPELGDFYNTTNENGYYRIAVDTGKYTLEVIPMNAYWKSCKGGQEVYLKNPYDSVRVDFPAEEKIKCAYLEVDISTDFLASCKDVNYRVSYCNHGTLGTDNAYVEVELDEKLDYIDASIQPSQQQGNTYTFQLGSLAPNQCGSINILSKLKCEGIAEGQASLVKAHIYPDTLCGIGLEWDRSKVIADVICKEDSVQFILKNIGSGAMRDQKRFIVVQDHVIFLERPYQLVPQQEESITIKSNGATYRIIAEQTEGNPTQNFATAAVEGCVPEGDAFTTGFIAEFPEDDFDPAIAIDVQEIIGSEENVALRGYPKGYKNLLIADNTDLTYQVFFENQGADTIRRVVIRDTLPQALDITSIVPGTSSHPYRFELFESGIMKITFSDIELLPVSSAGGGNISKGFVRFRVSQKPGNAKGTLIKNTASVYFGYRAPIQTNTVVHEVGEFPVFIQVNVVNPLIPGLEVKVAPNPFVQSTRLIWEGLDVKQGYFKLYDLRGRMMSSAPISGTSFEFNSNTLQRGTYFFTLDSKGSIFAGGKLLAQ